VNGARLGAIVRLELTQRLRSVAWYVLLGVFALILLVITGLAFAASGLGEGSGGWLFSLLIMLVLLLALLVSPTLSGNSVNGDRDAATLAPLQVTLATTAEILLAKWLAAWIAGLAFLVVALPFLIVATFAGELQPVTIVASLLILVVEVGIVAAIGVGLSAVIARPLFSVASTYLVVAALTLGTLIAFGLGGAATRVEVTTYQRDAYNGSCTPWTEYSYEQPRFDGVWWILAANPFVVLADATPTTYSEYGSPEDLFGQIAWAVRTAQIAPETEVRYDYCDSASVDDEYETQEEQIRGTSPSWFVGLLVQVLLAGGLMTWGWARTRTPARRLPPGTRIA
jgi:ABC-2 type transport system permease protein